MTRACPVNPHVIDERTARLTALFILVLLVLALWSRSPWIALLMAIDFGLRGFGLGRSSPLARLASSLRSAVGASPELVNAGPKQFAAKIGLTFSLVMAATQTAGLGTSATVVGGALGACAALEGFFGLCVGCYIYQFLPHRLPRSERPLS